MRQGNCDIERYIHEYGAESRRHHGTLMKKLEIHDQRWETHQKHLQAQQLQYRQLEFRFSKLLEELLPITSSGNALLDWQHRGSQARKLKDLASPKLLPAASDEHRALISACERSPVSDDFLFGQVRDLISHCCSHHSMCTGSFKTSAHLPTRVLDVGDEYSEVFLYEPKGLETADYVALSYVWGKTAACVTTFSSLASRKQGIPWNIIPPLFQDVILLTRKLNFRYLWVDSLCIVQDDVGDWDRETSMMDRVYGDATLVVAAHEVSSPASNLLLGEKSEHHCTSGPVAWFGSDQIRANAFFRQGSSGSRLSTRAWVLQEHMLATRLLHVGADTVFWECNKSVVPLPLAPKEESSIVSSQPSDGLKLLTSAAQIESMSGQRSLELWWRVVEQFTSRRLSFESDKLIALSGLAQRFGAKLGPYAAGLWLKEDFVWSLSWRPRFTSTRPSTYTGPTWSWASISDSVLAPVHTRISSAAEVIDFETVLLGVNKFGAVQSAQLTLQSTFVEAEVKECESEGDQELIHVKRDDLSLVFAADAFDAVVPGVNLVLLKLFEDAEGNIACLVLSSAHQDTLPRNTWQRVAVVQLYKRRGERKWFQWPEEGKFRIV